MDGLFINIMGVCSIIAMLAGICIMWINIDKEMKNL